RLRVRLASATKAMTVRRPPQAHWRTSWANTRRRSSAHGSRRGRDTAGGAPGGGAAAGGGGGGAGAPGGGGGWGGGGGGRAGGGGGRRGGGWGGGRTRRGWRTGWRRGGGIMRVDRPSDGGRVGRRVVARAVTNVPGAPAPAQVPADRMRSGRTSGRERRQIRR